MPWQTKSKKVVFENPWLRVEDHSVINPAGNPAQYGIVHFKNRAVGVVALTDDQQIYLVGQSRYALNCYSWEIPEGGCPENEAVEDAAKRELREETGLIANSIEPLFKMHLSNSVTDETAYLFLATQLQAGEQELEESEDISVKKLALSEAIAMVERGEITDAITIAALYAIERRLAK
ncbi:NUDIX domain-containing protein [Celerinatantimonas sp. MCCC 1A17872]|uniref:NUDIX domain-containing protein n=1 Tax=Celerinatantimonas sp. MCCC 1A17872 TaxID=3177514 RepID=UPI0038C0EB6E